MKQFCTSLDHYDVAAGLALHQSLQARAGNFALTVLCMDEEVEHALRARALPNVRLLPVAELVRQYPPLAAARADRSEGEFQLTTIPWLFRHLLPQILAGELLMFLAGDLYFFSSLQPIYDEIGPASVALTPFRYGAAHATLERYGKFNNGWIALRHDATGLACAADWAEKCAAWCFAQLEPTRYGNQKYLDAWPARFPGVVALKHPGVNVAPWNVGDAVITGSPSGPQVDGQPVVFYHFHHLRHLARGLHDPGLHRYGVTPSAALRELVYQPYLRALGGAGPEPPDIVPPARPDDPRSGEALARLLAQLGAAESAAESSRSALAANSAAARQTLAESRDALRHTELFLKDVEQDRAEQRRVLLQVTQELEQAQFDLARTETEIKALQAEASAQSAGKDAQIASLTREMEKRSVVAAAVEQEEVRAMLAPYARKVRRLLVAKFHQRLLPEILWFSLFGTAVEVLGSPSDYCTAAPGAAGFHPEPFLEWLGEIDSLFDERAYRLAHPDVSAAIAAGSCASGWDHYLRFGQREGRSPGHPAYCPGLAEFDAVAFDGADAATLAPFLAGRLQPSQQLFISGFTPPTDWLPPGDGRSYLMGHTLYCERPPVTWVGPRQPSVHLGRHLTSPTAEEIYPEKPAQRADWPRISVVTVSHNQAARLEETLRSVLDQNYPNLEYIVIDGGSTDGSAEIIRRHASRLVWRVNDPVSGQAPALNRGFSRATGRILTWLDSGDRLAPGSLFTVGQTFLLHAADIVAGRCAMAKDGAPHHVLHRNHFPLDRIQPLSRDELLDLDRGWLHRPFFLQPEVFFTRDIYERAGGKLREDLRAGADYDLWVRLAAAGARLLALPEILAITREKPVATAADLRAISATHRPTA